MVGNNWAQDGNFLAILRPLFHSCFFPLLRKQIRMALEVSSCYAAPVLASSYSGGINQLIGCRKKPARQVHTENTYIYSVLYMILYMSTYAILGDGLPRGVLLRELA